MASFGLPLATSSDGVPILSGKKPIDNKGLNNITMKDLYTLPLVGDAENRSGRAKGFAKLDLTNGYHRVEVSKGDEWITLWQF